MNLWCPQCGAKRFSYTKLAEMGSPLIMKDRMKCKNPTCFYEFEIEWFETVRTEWIKEMAEARKQQLNVNGA